MAASIVSLKCPVCGAPFQPDSDRCSYCGSILVLKTDHPRIDPRLLNKAVVDEHIAEYRRTLRTDPHDETAHYGLGVAYFNLGLIEDSVRELTEAARLMPENPNIQVQLAVALREAARRGDTAAKRQVVYRVDTALHLDPNNVEALLLKAEVLIETGNRGAAGEYFRQVNSLDKDKAYDRLVETLTSLADEQEQANEWGALATTWRVIGEVDEGAAKRALTQFLDRNRKHIPSRESDTGRWLIGTFFVGALLVRAVSANSGTGSAWTVLALVAWIVALGAVLFWLPKRPSKAGVFNTSETHDLTQGKYDLDTTRVVAEVVAQRRAKLLREAQARDTARYDAAVKKPQ
jgi:hypothetical protein